MKRNSLNQTIKLSDEQKKQIISEIKAFYLDVRGEEIGIIEEEQILELFCEHMAPIIYNKALDDAQYWYRQQMENISADYFLLQHFTSFFILSNKKHTIYSICCIV